MMKKALAFLSVIFFCLHLTAAQTNVLQSINFSLAIYQQGQTNASGEKISDEVTQFTSRDFIAAIAAVTGQNFGKSARLVQCTAYAEVSAAAGSSLYSNLLYTNLTLPTNGYLSIGGSDCYGFYGNAGIITVSNDIITSAGGGAIQTNVISVISGSGATNLSVVIATNALTTITPGTNATGAVTNVTVVTQILPAGVSTSTVLTNAGTTIDILSANNVLFPVTGYFAISADPVQIVVARGTGLANTNAAPTSTLSAQNSYGLQYLSINYAGSGLTNLSLSLEGFVKQSMKIDPLTTRGGQRVAANVLGATATWNIIGNGSIGGTAGSNGALLNASPVVVEGTMNLAFLKNLIQ